MPNVDCIPLFIKCGFSYWFMPELLHWYSSVNIIKINFHHSPLLVCLLNDSSRQASAPNWQSSPVPRHGQTTIYPTLPPSITVVSFLIHFAYSLCISGLSTIRTEEVNQPNGRSFLSVGRGSDLRCSRSRSNWEI